MGSFCREIILLVKFPLGRKRFWGGESGSVLGANSLFDDDLFLGQFSDSVRMSLAVVRTLLWQRFWFPNLWLNESTVSNVPFDDRACLASICSGLSNLEEGLDVLFQRCRISASFTFDNRELIDGERVTLNQIGPRIWRLSDLFQTAIWTRTLSLLWSKKTECGRRIYLGHGRQGRQQQETEQLSQVDSQASIGDMIATGVIREAMAETANFCVWQSGSLTSF